jgi:carbon monoxide dehydrogenase subunit G
MTSIAVEVNTDAAPAAAWDAIRDIGGLHALVPGFVVATELVPGGRRVTFGNGTIVVEPIVSLNEDLRRLVWTVQGGSLGLVHYNGAVQVFAREIGGSRVVWVTDVLPDEAAIPIGAMMREGADAMHTALTLLARESAKSA